MQPHLSTPPVVTVVCGGEPAWLVVVWLVPPTVPVPEANVPGPEVKDPAGMQQRKLNAILWQIAYAMLHSLSRQTWRGVCSSAA